MPEYLATAVVDSTGGVSSNAFRLRWISEQGQSIDDRELKAAGARATDGHTRLPKGWILS